MALTAGIVSLAVALADERKGEILARSAEPQPGWTRDVLRSCDRQHEECHGFGVRYELHHRPRLALDVYECECTRYELVYRPILVPSERQLAAEMPEPEARSTSAMTLSTACPKPSKRTESDKRVDQLVKAWSRKDPVASASHRRKAKGEATPAGEEEERGPHQTEARGLIGR